MINGELNFVLIGAKSTGKTVYLTMLSMRPEIGAKDPKTIEYLKPLRNKLRNKETLSASNLGIWELLFNYNDRGHKYSVEFQIDDYDGKFVEQLSTKEDADYKQKLMENIEESEGIIFFLPYSAEFDSIKLENVRDEIDLFIETVKKIYPNKKSLPIPVTLAVTKWDLSPDFKDKQEDKKAEEYIDSISTLKNIKEKIENYFSHIQIIPLSSFKDHNLLRPIDFFLDKTFATWEEKINTLKQEKNDEDLLVFLKEILFDIQHYKDGEYVKMYDELEEKIYITLEGQANSIEKFAAYEEFLKNKNELIVSLKNEHQHTFGSIEKKLKAKKRRKNNLMFLGVATVFFGIGYIVYAQGVEKKEEMLFASIEKAFEHQNDKDLLPMLSQYKKEYGNKIDELHYKRVVEIENKEKQICRNDVDVKLDTINKMKSLKSINALLLDLGRHIKLCGIDEGLISKKIEAAENNQQSYKTTLKAINDLSLTNLNDSTFGNIQMGIHSTKGYIESEELQTLLAEKINTIKDIALDSINIQPLQKFINLTSQVDISTESREALQDRLSILMAEKAYTLLKDNIESMNFMDSAQSIASKWEDGFRLHQEEIKVILNTKYNMDIENKLTNFPGEVDTENDLNELSNKLADIAKLENDGRISMVDYIPDMSSDNLSKLQKEKEKRDKYASYTVIPSNIVFKASSETNEPLGFSCVTVDSDDDLSLNISGTRYEDKFGNCSGLAKSWGNSSLYRSSSYNVKVTEWDPVSNDTYGGSLSISKNDIIKLKNGKEVEKDIGNGYSIIFRP